MRLVEWCLAALVTVLVWPAAAQELPQVASNAALQRLPSTQHPAVQRLGYLRPGDGGAALYHSSAAACSLGAGNGDNGWQVRAANGGCWIADLPAATPLLWGAVGDGNANDTAAVQAAINGAAAAGVTLNFDARHLYNITATLNIAQPVEIGGAAYRYGMWTVNDPLGTGQQRCPWGLVTKNTGITMVSATAVTGTIRGMCFDMTGGQQLVQAASGAAIRIAPPDVNTYQSGWHVELNTILQPYDGITFDGAGPNPAACCGRGTTSNGVTALWNTIVNPADIGISIGRSTVYAASVGITLVDNAIICGKGGTSRGRAGVAVFDGGGWYDGTMNGPVGCTTGVEVAPAAIGADSQWVQFYGDGVMGDQSALHDLWVHPGNGGWISPLRIGGKGAWANQTGVPNQNRTSVLIDCTAPVNSYCDPVTVNNFLVLGGTNQDSPIFDVEAGPGGPVNFTLTGSSILQGGTGAVANGNATALLLNFPGGQAYAGNYTITGNQIGGASLGCCTAPNTVPPRSLQLSLNANTVTKVNITGNNLTNTLNLPTRAIAYQPSVNDQVVVANNVGVDTQEGSFVAAATVTLVDAYGIYFVGGNTTISRIEGAWQGRQVRLASDGSGINLCDTGACPGGNICASSVSGAQTVSLIWMPHGTCWTHVP